MAKKKIADETAAKDAAGGTPAPAPVVDAGKAETLAKARQQRTEKANSTRYKAVSGRSPVAGEKKLAPQAAEIVKVVEEHGEAGVLRPALIEALKGRLKTKQPEERILTYYQKALVDGGYVTTSEDASSA